MPAWGIWPEYDGQRAVLRGHRRPAGAVPDRDLRSRPGRRALRAGRRQPGGPEPALPRQRRLERRDEGRDGHRRSAHRGRHRGRDPAAERQPPTHEARRLGDYDLAMQAFCPGYIAENLELFHSKNYVPLGETGAVVRAQLVPLPEPGPRRDRRPDVPVDPADTAALTPLYPRRDGDLAAPTCRSSRSSRRRRSCRSTPPTGRAGRRPKTRGTCPSAGGRPSTSSSTATRKPHNRRMGRRHQAGRSQLRTSPPTRSPLRCEGRSAALSRQRPPFSPFPLPQRGGRGLGAQRAVHDVSRLHRT